MARAIALRRLDSKAQSRAELADYLRKRNTPEDIAEQVLDRFVEVGLLDDASFAQAWAASRQRNRGLARSVIRQELRRKGIEEGLVADAIDQIDDAQELDAARRLAEQKARTMAELPHDVAFRRLSGMLARRGYPPGVVYQVVREVLAASESGDSDFTD